MEVHDQFEPGPNGQSVDPRRHPRYALDTGITVHSRTSGVLSGRTVDISESGLSAILKIEVPVGEVVKLEIVYPAGLVTVFAVTRNRSAFRYGFEFMDTNPPDRLVTSICQQLPMAKAGGK
jgi:PilZ domain